MSDLSKNLTFILKNSANNSVLDSIFDLGSRNSTSIHQFYDSASTRLRLQSFGIRLNDETGVGTPLRQNFYLARFKPTATMAICVGRKRAVI